MLVQLPLAALETDAIDQHGIMFAAGQVADDPPAAAVLDFGVQALDGVIAQDDIGTGLAADAQGICGFPAQPIQFAAHADENKVSGVHRGFYLSQCFPRFAKA
jgi:hypothetical protein